MHILRKQYMQFPQQAWMIRRVASLPIGLKTRPVLGILSWVQQRPSICSMMLSIYVCICVWHLMRRKSQQKLKLKWLLVIFALACNWWLIMETQRKSGTRVAQSFVTIILWYADVSASYLNVSRFSVVLCWRLTDILLSAYCRSDFT